MSTVKVKCSINENLFRNMKRKSFAFNFQYLEHFSIEYYLRILLFLNRILLNSKQYYLYF